MRRLISGGRSRWSIRRAELPARCATCVGLYVKMRTAQVLAVVMALAVWTPEPTSATRPDYQKKDFCQLYQWVCKAVCHTACCHIPIGLPIGNPQEVCTESDARRSGKTCEYCCNGEGPVHGELRRLSGRACAQLPPTASMAPSHSTERLVQTPFSQTSRTGPSSFSASQASHIMSSLTLLPP